MKKVNQVEKREQGSAIEKEGEGEGKGKLLVARWGDSVWDWESSRGGLAVHETKSREKEG